MVDQTPPPAPRLASRDPDRLCWPPLRSDCVGLGCLSLSTYCIVTTTWPVVAVAALVFAVFAGVSPRMKGQFGLKAGDISLGGRFVSPFDGATPAELAASPAEDSRPDSGRGAAGHAGSARP